MAGSRKGPARSAMERLPHPTRPAGTLVARLLSLALHAGGLAAAFTLPPAQGGNNPDQAVLMVEMVAPPPDPAPPEPEPQPHPEPQKQPAPLSPAAAPKRVRAAAPAPLPAVPAEAPTPAEAEPAPAAPAPAVPIPAAAPGQGSDLREYSAEIWRRILSGKPDRARYPGEVAIRFVIAADGGLAGMVVERSSGVPALDTLALEIVRRAAPFPAPPASNLSFTIPFRFR